MTSTKQARFWLLVLLSGLAFGAAARLWFVPSHLRGNDLRSGKVLCADQAGYQSFFERQDCARAVPLTLVNDAAFEQPDPESRPFNRSVLFVSADDLKSREWGSLGKRKQEFIADQGRYFAVLVAEDHSITLLCRQPQRVGFYGLCCSRFHPVADTGKNTLDCSPIICRKLTFGNLLLNGEKIYPAPRAFYANASLHAGILAQHDLQRNGVSEVLHG